MTHAAHPQPRTHGSCVPIERAVLVVMRMKAVTAAVHLGLGPGCCDTHSDRLDFRLNPVLGKGVLDGQAAVDAVRCRLAVLGRVPQLDGRQRHQRQDLCRDDRQEGRCRRAEAGLGKTGHIPAAAPPGGRVLLRVTPLSIHIRQIKSAV